MLNIASSNHNHTFNKINLIMKRNLLTQLFLGLIFCFLGNTTVLAQGPYKCGTTQMHKKMLAEHPELAQVESDYNALLTQQMNSRDADSNHVYIIPIVFHVIHINGAENISDAQILDQVNILNRDFRKRNADTSAIIPPYQGVAKDMKIEFRLAQIDPNGNCTNGIDRIYSHKTDNANDESKLNPWPRDKYLNVWVIKTMESVGTAGYAYYPSATASFGEPVDGIIIIHQYIGSIGTANVTNSRALTHEVGHWLNLPHTWGSTNDPEVGCGDEGVNDTPTTAGHNNCGNRYDFECDSKPLTATYTFTDVTTSSGTTDPTAAPEATDSTITFTNPTAVGVTTNSSSTGMFEFADWDTGSAAIDGDTTYALMTGAINTGKYYEFSISPDLLPQALALSTISFTVKRDTNGIRSFSVRSNADGYAANLAASITPLNANLNKRGSNEFFIKYDTTASLVGSRITLSGTAFSAINNTTRTFRIYGWNAEDTTGTFAIDNITITGSHGIIENVENYMEYSYCSKMYTGDQKTRMRSALENSLSSRDNLWINSNLIATGTNGVAPTCAPVADFYSNRQTICPGNNITFTQNVMNIAAVFGTTTYTSLPTTYSWSFPGGTPSSSSSATPSAVTYSTPGSYDVTLTVTNANGTHTLTKTNFVNVSTSYAMVPNTYSENFENSTQFYNNWYSKDLDNNSRTWWYNGAAGYSGTHSVRMNAYYNYAYDVDQLFSPSYNLTFITSPSLTFRLAGATKATTAADMNDKLYVYSSVDCGATWSLRKTLTGTALNNNSYHPEEFVPTSPSQWSLITVTGVPTGPNVRFKFEYTSGHEGNTIYIDDVNMNGTVGIDEALIDANVSIYPNPASETATIAYTLGKKGDVHISLVDVLGKQVMAVNNLGQAEGDYTFQISKQELNLRNGVYFVKFSINNSTVTKKLVISE